MREREKSFLITTEHHEVVIVRGGKRETSRAFCPDCAFEVDVVGFDAAIAFSRSSGRELIRRIETGAIHSIETAIEDFGLCRRSLVMEYGDVEENRE